MKYLLRGERERGWVGGILKIVVGRRVFGIRGAGSYVEVILSLFVWRSGVERGRGGKDGVVVLFYFSFCFS